MREIVNTIDHRMESFIARFGEIPAEARRLSDAEARTHTAPWIQRVLGKGLACAYVSGYVVANDWWTFCFERGKAAEPGRGNAEVWTVEAYDSRGVGWCERFNYWPDLDLWQRDICNPHHPPASPHIPN
jgi:hypothetical protein